MEEGFKFFLIFLLDLVVRLCFSKSDEYLSAFSRASYDALNCLNDLCMMMVGARAKHVLSWVMEQNDSAQFILSLLNQLIPVNLPNREQILSNIFECVFGFSHVPRPLCPSQESGLETLELMNLTLENYSMSEVFIHDMFFL